MTGGRRLRDRGLVYDALDLVLAELGGTFLLVHGAAAGADTLADEWAADRGCTALPYPAQWTRPDGTRDLSAGHRRNAEMVALLPDQLIAFPGGEGTASAVRMARRRAIPTRRAYRRTTTGLVVLEAINEKVPPAGSLGPLFDVPRAR